MVNVVPFFFYLFPLFFWGFYRGSWSRSKIGFTFFVFNWRDSLHIFLPFIWRLPKTDKVLWWFLCFFHRKLKLCCFARSKTCKGFHVWDGKLGLLKDRKSPSAFFVQTDSFTLPNDLPSFGINWREIFYFWFYLRQIIIDTNWWEVLTFNFIWEGNHRWQIRSIEPSWRNITDF